MYKQAYCITLHIILVRISFMSHLQQEIRLKQLVWSNRRLSWLQNADYTVRLSVFTSRDTI